jgi:uncharacterized protein (DUF433 family)
MIATPPTIAVPLRTDEHGVIRVSGTRVTLESVISVYKQDRSAEVIHEAFDVIPLADAYAVIAYYLSHTQEVDAYMKHAEEEGERIRAKWEKEYPPKVTFAELKARYDAMKRDEGNA